MEDDQKSNDGVTNINLTTPDNETISAPEVSSPADGGLGKDVKPKQKKFDLKSLLKKRTAVVVLILVVLFGGSAAAYFGYVVPNKPENIWNSAMARTADGYDKLLEQIEKTEEAKGYKVTGKLKSEGVISADGSLEIKSYGNNGTLKADIGMAGVRVDIEGRMIAEEGKDPDMYFKARGLSSISQLFAGSEYADIAYLVDSIEDQWIYIDRTLISQAGGSSMDAGESRQVALDVFSAIGQVNREYLFTSDKDKSVLEIVENIGKEDKEGRSSYHYKVKANKDNFFKYLDSLAQNLSQSKTIDDTTKKQMNNSIKKLKESLEGETDDNDKSYIDMWVDMKTKLVSALRVTDDDKHYIEIGMPYGGGDDYPLNLIFNSSEGGPKSEATMKMVYNPSRDKISIDFDVDVSSGGDEDIKLTANVDIEPSDSKVDVTKPEGAKSVMEYIGLLFGGYGGYLDSLPIDTHTQELTL